MFFRVMLYHLLGFFGKRYRLEARMFVRLCMANFKKLRKISKKKIGDRPGTFVCCSPYFSESPGVLQTLWEPSKPNFSIFFAIFRHNVPRKRTPTHSHLSAASAALLAAAWAALEEASDALWTLPSCTRRLQSVPKNMEKKI